MTPVYFLFSNLAKILARVFFRMRVVGRENMVESGRGFAAGVRFTISRGKR